MKKITQSGFSLPEVMIAMGLGLVLLLGVVTFYSSSMNASRISDESSNIQESARAVFDVLRNDTMMAGYASCYNDLDPSSTDDNPGTDFSGMTTISYGNSVGPTGMLMVNDALLSAAESKTLAADNNAVFGVSYAIPVNLLSTTLAPSSSSLPLASASTFKINRSYLLINCYNHAMRTFQATSSTGSLGAGTIDDRFIETPDANFERRNTQLLEIYQAVYSVENNILYRHRIYLGSSGTVLSRTKQELIRGVTDVTVDDSNANDGIVRISMTFCGNDDCTGTAKARTLTTTANVRNRT